MKPRSEIDVPLKRCVCGRLIAVHSLDEARVCLEQLVPAPSWFESCPIARHPARAEIQNYAMDPRD